MKEIISLLGAIALTPWVMQETAGINSAVTAHLLGVVASGLHACVTFALLWFVILCVVDFLEACWGTVALALVLAFVFRNFEWQLI